MPQGRKKGTPKTGGRRKGSGNRDKTVLLKQSKLTGKTPIQVMTGNMQFWDKHALKMMRNLERMSRKTVDPVLLEAIGKMMERMRDWRANAQACAEGLAPYVHPRLQAITLGGDQNNPLQVTVSGGLPDGGGL